MKNLLYPTLLLFLFSACSKHSGSSVSVQNVVPAYGGDSATVHLIGSGFGSSTANVQVSFNGKSALIVNATPTDLEVQVPTLAGSGDIVVTIGGKAQKAPIPFTYDTTWRVTNIADNINSPFCLSFDPGGNLYFASWDDSIVHKYTPAGAMSQFIRMPGVTGHAFDAAGNLYLVQNSNGLWNFKSVTPAGVVTPIASVKGEIMQIAVDANGNIYAANDDSSYVQKITPQGVVSIVASNLYYVGGLALASDGTIYAAHYTTHSYTPANGVISKISPSGTVTTLAHIAYDGESEITLDDKNNVYAAVFDQPVAIGYVVMVSPDGVVHKLVSNNIWQINGIARDKSGNLYTTQLQTTTTSIMGCVDKLVMH